MESDSGDRTDDHGVTDDAEPVDGGPAPGGVTTYEVNDEGVLVNTATGQAAPEQPTALEDTMPGWLWNQHIGVTRLGSPAQEADL